MKTLTKPQKKALLAIHAKTTDNSSASRAAYQRLCDDGLAGYVQGLVVLTEKGLHVVRGLLPPTELKVGDRVYHKGSIAGLHELEIVAIDPSVQEPYQLRYVHLRGGLIHWMGRQHIQLASDLDDTQRHYANQAKIHAIQAGEMADLLSQINMIGDGKAQSFNEQGDTICIKLSREQVTGLLLNLRKFQ